jgi:hypothetical protein
MNKIMKHFLIWSTVLGFLPLIPPAIDEYKLRKEMDKANVRVTTPFVMSWKDIAGFYGANNDFSNIVVRKSLLPIKVMLPYLSETRRYKPGDVEFNRCSLILKNPELYDATVLKRPKAF